jgi:hypothetical protein
MMGSGSQPRASDLGVPRLGVARLDGMGTARIAGSFVIGVENKLDPALDQPRTPLVPVK